MYPLFLVKPTGKVAFEAIRIEPGCRGGAYHRGVVVYGYTQCNPEETAEIPNAGWDIKVLKCDYCDHLFADQTPCSLSARRFWIRPDTGEIKSDVREFGPGASYYADWLSDIMKSEWDNWHDGAPLTIQMPNNDSWMPESRASNCTMPEDKLHRCWCLHGEFPKLTADKNGLTCNAGAGSILSRGWHGFLTNGVLSEQR